MSDGIEIRRYLQEQDHTFITNEQAEAITADLLKMLDLPTRPSYEGPFGPVRRPASADFPLNFRYIKPVLGRARKAYKAWRERLAQWDVATQGPAPQWMQTYNGFNESTMNKHKRCEEIESMYVEIDRLRAQVEMLGMRR